VLSFLNIKAFNKGHLLKITAFVEIFVKSGKSIFSKSWQFSAKPLFKSIKDGKCKFSKDAQFKKGIPPILVTAGNSTYVNFLQLWKVPNVRFINLGKLTVINFEQEKKLF